ncbi:hypothetical protein V6N11_053768 [Hibiscus sabdariffa]|uniref:BED-type domain-containing protein n=2 Tax=Hibiscus sabdariffa TaxID=183260 RepID=A0ABR2S1W4_9ROSI
MGKEIVHQESKNPGKRSRLWSSKDVYHVLKNNKGTESIEGIKLDTSQIDYLQLCSSIFENMLNLRYMHFYGPSKKLHADGVDIVSLPDELRHLCWEYYPFKSLSPSFNPKNLAVLILEYGDMEQLWKKDNRQDLGNLREIYIYCCKKLKELPNLLGAINLKRLSCYGCESLVELPCLNHLASLELLELSKCKNLRKIPSLLGANNLKILDCKWCASLVELPCLNHLTSLETLLIYGCYSLKKFPELPNNFYKLDLSRTGIEEVSDSIEHLFRLEKLFLTSSEVKNVSSNISRLRSLSKLVIDDCISLKSLSELPRYLWSLRANNCSSLENVSFTDQNLYQFNSLYDVDDDGDGDDGDVAYLKFYNCFSLNQDSIKNIESNAMLQIQALSQIWSRERVLFRDGIRQRKSRFNKFFCCLPGNEILANGFEYQSMNSWLNLKIGLNRCSGGRFLAFAICFVVDLTHCNLFDLQFKCELLLKTGNCAKFKTLFLFCDGHSRVYKGNHVLILFYRNMIIRDNDYKEASFKFSFDNDFGKETEDEFTKVKKCGVHLFYVDAESYAVSAATEIGPGDNRSLSYRDENFGTQEDANIEEAHDHIGGEEGEGGIPSLKPKGEGQGLGMTLINNEKDQTFEPTQIVEESQETRLEENENEEDDLKKRSFVWDHFKYEKNITSAKCPYCKRMIKCDSKKNGTSGLGKHLKMYCRQSPCYKLPDKKQKTLNFSPPQPLSGKSDVKGNMYNQVACRMALARMCIKDNRPFSIVEDEGFVEYSSTLNPKFKLPSRWTVARDCFNIYKEESKMNSRTLQSIWMNTFWMIEMAIEDLKMLCHAIVGIVFVGMSNCVKVFLKTYYWDVLVGRPLLNTVAALDRRWQPPTASMASLSAKVHLLVIFNIFDCYVRCPDQTEIVIGMLLNSVLPDRTIDIHNSYAIPHTESTEQVALDIEYQYHHNMLISHQKVKRKEVTVGWYCTGLGVAGSSSLIHDFYYREVPNPIHLTVYTGFRNGEGTAKAYVSVNLALGDQQLGAQFQEIPLDLHESIASCDITDGAAVEGGGQRGVLDTKVENVIVGWPSKATACTLCVAACAWVCVVASASMHLQDR